MSDRPQRPLAPAPPGVPRPPPNQPPPQRKRNAVAACTACKSRKLKCSGESPCVNCQKNGTECEINVDNDQRRRIGVKRKLESLEEDRDLLVELFSTLRESGNREVIALINQIRNCSNLEDVKSFLDDKVQSSQLERTPELEQAYSEVRRLQQTTQRPSAMDLNRLSDRPLFDVPCKPWTFITDDDGLVSHLISMWFTWNAPFFNWVDPEPFLADMKSGKLDSHYCSPFLVNAMLAEACFYSDYPETCAVHGDLASKGVHFWKEAKRLLDDEEGKVTMSTVLGVGIMYFCTCIMGRGRLGWLYIVHLADHIRVLRSSQSRVIAACGLPRQRGCELLDRLELGLFSATTISCIRLQKPGKVDKPSGIRLPVHEHNQQDTWTPYPRLEKPIPAHSHCLINHLADIADISYDVAHAFFGGDNKPPRADLEEKVNGWHSKLREWSENLAPCMDYRKNPLPGILTLHMCYHTQIMTILSPLSVPPPGSDEATVASAKSARETCLSAARAVGELMEIQKSNWGFHPMVVVNMQWIVVALFVLMDDLDNPDSLTHFVELCIAATYPARRWLLLKGMFRLVQITAQQKHKVLPEAVQRLFNDFESKYWKAEDRERFSSAYPVFAASLRQQDDYIPDDFELDVFLEQWDHMGLEGVADGAGDKKES